jgi:hypothetical protein
VAGQVVGAVTSAGGSTSVVVANTSDNVDATTGDAHSSNAATGFVGQEGIVLADILSSNVIVQGNVVECASCTPAPLSNVLAVGPTVTAAGANVQGGSNRLSGDQTASASTGDGVAGQVIGAVSAGATSIDASNTSRDSSAQTGDATASNGVNAVFVGQADLGSAAGGVVGDAGTADVSGVAADNVQNGDNTQRFAQTAGAVTGDAVAGQVAGVVTSAGGAASVVVANDSTNIDAASGDGVFRNSEGFFVGLSFASATVLR